MSLSSYWLEQPHLLGERLIQNVEKVLVGKRDTIERAVIALLCGGHVLLEDVPGVGKTMLIRALARSIGCEFKRIQGTPDLLPSDITGVSVYQARTGEFVFRPGPLLSQVVLADELNRCAPKTQAALLEAMAEGRVTVDGESHELPKPFFLLATQNPLDFEGTYSLPEAQLDRFLMRLSLGYPDMRSELQMLERLGGERSPLETLRPVLTPEELAQLQRETAAVHVDESLRRYIVALVAATRTHRDVLLGASPRASAALYRASQARAFLQGRSYAIPDDVKALAESVLAHRLQPSMEARLAGRTASDSVNAIVRTEPIPGAAAAPSVG